MFMSELSGPAVEPLTGNAEPLTGRAEQLTDNADPPTDADPPTEAATSSSKWPLALAFLILTSMLIDAILLTVLVPLTPQLVTRFQVDEAFIGLLFSSKALVQILTSPITAKVVNLLGPRVVVCSGLVVLVVSTGVYAESGSSYAIALTARAVQGIASSSILVGGQTFLLRLSDGDEGELFGIATFGIAAGVLLGPTVGGWLASPNVFGLDGMFWALTAVAGFVLIVHTLILYVVLPTDLRAKVSNVQAADAAPSQAREVAQPGPEIVPSASSSFRILLASNREGSAPAEDVEATAAGEPTATSANVGSTETLGLRRIIVMPSVWRIMLGILAANFTIAMLEPVAPEWSVDKLAIDSQDTGTLGLMWAAAPLGFLIFTPISGLFADRCRKNHLMGVGLASIIAGLLVLRTTSLSFGGIPLFEVALFMVGSGAAFVETPSQVAMAAAVGPQGSAAGFAALDMAMNLGFIGGPLIGSKFGLQAEGAGILFLAVAASLALFVILLIAKAFHEAGELGNLTT